MESSGGVVNVRVAEVVGFWIYFKAKPKEFDNRYNRLQEGCNKSRTSRLDPPSLA